MNDINIYPRKFQWFPPLAATLLFAATGGLILTMRDSAPLIVVACAWVMLGMAFIGLVAVGKLLIFHHSGPVLILSNQGINYVPAPFGVVPWNEVVHVAVRSNGLVICVRDNLPYFNALPLWKRCACWSGLSLPGDLLLITRQKVQIELNELFSLIRDELQVRENAPTAQPGG